ncbi:uncharacterized protein LACBIDRAFT_299582 [Laccaria bicolor S238N-H82]|uniref:Predicted protein n=1 Tax=Laccaria bicolor (strain S238N-H82 / ATCC MYA-4686) TaxID=486041 RepID=B0DEX0_LACBS|nr:uncharacterized protein LACBIDRAFT_299582 [Laccaria bicolor S238N-H82]EDR06746.1 predicted protein [Laccaria bicolor S238N-H82]|eukprot:XP_001882593.1 predicted protein [Laccaria bicolor S238N-H82]
MQNHFRTLLKFARGYLTYGTIQRRLAWPLHKDDTLSRSGRPTGLNIYFVLDFCYCWYRSELGSRLSRATVEIYTETS